MKKAIFAFVIICAFILHFTSCSKEQKKEKKEEIEFQSNQDTTTKTMDSGFIREIDQQRGRDDCDEVDIFKFTYLTNFFSGGQDTLIIQREYTDTEVFVIVNGTKYTWLRKSYASLTESYRISFEPIEAYIENNAIKIKAEYCYDDCDTNEVTVTKDKAVIYYVNYPSEWHKEIDTLYKEESLNKVSQNSENDEPKKEVEKNRLRNSSESKKEYDKFKRDFEPISTCWKVQVVYYRDDDWIECILNGEVVDGMRKVVFYKKTSDPKFIERDYVQITGEANDVTKDGVVIFKTDTGGVKRLSGEY